MSADLVGRASTLRELGRYREVLELLLPHLPGLPDAEFVPAACCASEAHRHLGEYEAAQRLAEAALARDPNTAWAHAERARSLHMQDRHAAALEEIHRAQALAPGAAHYHIDEALVLMSAHRLEDAVAAVRRALALDPMAPGHHAVLARLLLTLGLGTGKLEPLAEADALIKKGLALDPTNADLLGLEAERLAFVPRKMELLRAALRQNPHNAHHQRQLQVLGRFSSDMRIAVVLTALNLLGLAWATAGFADFSEATLDGFRKIGIPLLLLAGSWLMRATNSHQLLVLAFMTANAGIVFPELLPDVARNGWWAVPASFYFVLVMGLGGLAFAGGVRILAEAIIQKR